MTESPLLALLHEDSTEPVTLDDWLNASGCEDVFDAELLDVVPEEFESEYRDRIKTFREARAR